MTKDSTPLRALALFLAAATALALASASGINNPFWAAMPVWVIAQAYRQDLLIRGVLRIVGTLAGAGAAWLILYHLSDPVLQALALGIVVGAGTFAAFWIGTVYSYWALMIAVTVSVVVLPALDHPLDGRAYVIDRTICTLIGVAAVTLMTFAITPKRGEKLPIRINHGLYRAVWQGTFAAVAAVIAALMCTYIGGPTAMGAALSLAVFATLIGGTPQSGIILDNLVPGAAIGVIAAIIYRLIAVWLGLDGMALVVIALPFLAAGAVLRTHHKTAPLGLDANMCFLLAAEVGAQGHTLWDHLSAGVALIAAGTLVTMVYNGKGHLRLMRFLSSQ